MCIDSKYETNTCAHANWHKKVYCKWLLEYILNPVQASTHEYPTFCLSGVTLVREKSCILKTIGGSSVFSSTPSNFSLPHFTFTASHWNHQLNQVEKYGESQFLPLKSGITSLCTFNTKYMCTSSLENLSPYFYLKKAEILVVVLLGKVLATTCTRF